MPATTKTLDELILAPELAQQLETLAQRLADGERIERLGGTVPTGVLLIGPPGTGKTETARSLAKESNWAFLPTTGHDLLADPREIDRLVEEARNLRPCLIFIDEADDILRDRTRSLQASVTNKLLAAMDGAGGRVPDVVFLAATNHAEAIDPAMLRGGRFTEKLHFLLPDVRQLFYMVGAWCGETPTYPLGDDLPTIKVAERLRGLSIPTAQAVLRESINQAIGRSGSQDVPQVSRADLDAAIRTIVGWKSPRTRGGSAGGRLDSGVTMKVRCVTSQSLAIANSNGGKEPARSASPQSTRR